MNRIDRLQAILIQLQSKKITKAQELADRFEISLRTVYRDIRALEEAGVPVGAEAGIGYFLMDGYHLPPVAFTTQEAQALLMGAKIVEKMTDNSVGSAFQSAMYKIKSVLKNSSKEHLDVLEKNISILKTIPSSSRLFDSHFLIDIQQAIVQKNVVTIEYYSYHSNEMHTRNIEPIGLLHYGFGWHVIAFCQLRNAYRDFRADRIKSLTITPKPFQNLPHHSLPEYLQSIAKVKNLQEVVVYFEKSVVRHIGEQKYFYGFIGEEECDHRIRMHFLTSYIDAMAHWLLMYTHQATVEQPAYLYDKMKKLAQDIQEHYL